ncbi:MAG: hypothetical protein GY769_20280 [bacterium]|nr:hypothetical protein [bacterium]
MTRRVNTLGQLRGVGQLPTGAKAVLWVGAVGLIGLAFVWGMARTIEA